MVEPAASVESRGTAEITTPISADNERAQDEGGVGGASQHFSPAWREDLFNGGLAKDG